MELEGGSQGWKRYTWSISKITGNRNSWRRAKFRTAVLLLLLKNGCESMVYRGKVSRYYLIHLIAPPSTFESSKEDLVQSFRQSFWTCELGKSDLPLDGFDLVIIMGGKYGILCGEGGFISKDFGTFQRIQFHRSFRRICFEEIVIPFGEFILVERLVLSKDLILLLNIFRKDFFLKNHINRSFARIIF